MNKYPIYIISKGRSSLKNHTAEHLINSGVKCKIVVEPQEASLYAARFSLENILVLPFSNLGQGSIPARNWCWEHSISNKYKRHWIMDDNISGIVKWRNHKRVKCDPVEAFCKLESITDKFINIAIAGMNYRFTACVNKPFFLNCHVYSCMLILNDLPFRWRGRYNEDTDLCLQSLTSNWCTVNYNTYLINKAATMTCKGGNTDQLYKGNGRLKMSRSLELEWANKLPPGTVRTSWKFNRPQHHVNGSIFKTPLKRIEDASA